MSKHKALEGMLKDGWTLEDNTVETMDQYRQLAVDWLEENIELSEHIGFVLDYISNLEKLLELYRYLNENTNDYDLDLKTVEEIHNKIEELENE